MASAANQDTYVNPTGRAYPSGTSAWGPGASGQWGRPGGDGPGWGQSGEANNQASGARPWGAPPGATPWAYGPPWGGPSFWHPAGLGRPAAIAFTVLGFMFWWPVGLALLIYMIGSGRMGCMGSRRRAMYRAQNWQNGSDAGPFAAWRSWMCGSAGSAGRPAASSGNHAFDEYKTETLRRLEEEQKEFSSFLERLRFAKDKAEFDQFMAERRNRPPAPPTGEQPANA